MLGDQMRYFILFLFLFTRLAVAETNYTLPIHSPWEVEVLIKDYLEREYPKIDLSEYNYWGLSYMYMEGGFWTANFDCKKRVKLGCHFGVQVSNSKSPKFTFHGG